MSVGLRRQHVEGHFNDTPLAGLNWAGLYKWPGEIKNGNSRHQIVIDERADETQRIALETFISGEAGAPLSNPMINEFTGQPFHIALARPSGSF